MSFLEVPFFLSGCGLFVVFSWPLQKNSTTKRLLLPNRRVPESFTRHALLFTAPGSRGPRHARFSRDGVTEPGSFSGTTQTFAGGTPALHFFGGAHLRAARPRIAISLFFAGCQRLFGQQLVPALLRALAHCI